MPGWIDTHVHPTRFFNKDDRLELDGPGAKSTPQQAALHAEANLYATLMGVFTAVQSVGAALDDLNDLIGRDSMPGSRLLTSPALMTDKSGGPEQIRALVDKLKADGAPESLGMEIMRNTRLDA